MKNYKKLFPFFIKHHNIIYLDSAATTLKFNSVITNVNNYYLNYSINAYRNENKLAYKCQEIILNTRKIIAKFINAKDHKSIIFTSNTTDSTNKAALMLEEILKPNDEIILTKIDHSSNLVPWFNIAKKTKAKLIFVDVDKNNIISLTQVKKNITEKTKILAINHISNAVGKINEVEKIGQFLEKSKNKIYYYVDAAQSIAHTITNVQKIKCDFLGFSGHKIYGPTGIGVLYINENILNCVYLRQGGGGSIVRLSTDGFIEYKKYNQYEPGTLNYAGIFGLSKSIEQLYKLNFNNVIKYEKSLTLYLYNKLLKVDNIQMISKNPDIPIICFNIKNIFCQDVSHYLAQNNVYTRSGEQCIKLKNSFSKDNYLFIRISLAIYNTKNDIDTLVKLLTKKIDFLANIT